MSIILGLTEYDKLDLESIDKWIRTKVIQYRALLTPPIIHPKGDFVFSFVWISPIWYAIVLHNHADAQNNYVSATATPSARADLQAGGASTWVDSLHTWLRFSKILILSVGVLSFFRKPSSTIYSECIDCVEEDRYTKANILAQN